MSATRIGVLAALTTVALLRPLAASQAPVTLGQWVRVVTPSDSVVARGRLLLVVGDSVALGHGQHMEYRVLGAQGRLEASTRLRRHILAGGLLGAAVGVMVGAAIPALRSAFVCPGFYCPPQSGLALGPGGRMALGGVIGFGLGALIGAHTYTTQWDPVPADQLDRLRVGLVPQPGGQLGLGGSLAF